MRPFGWPVVLDCFACGFLLAAAVFGFGFVWLGAWWALGLAGIEYNSRMPATLGQSLFSFACAATFYGVARWLLHISERLEAVARDLAPDEESA